MLYLSNPWGAGDRPYGELSSGRILARISAGKLVMDKQEILTLFAQIIAVALVLMVCLPHLLLWLGVRRYRNGVYGGPEDLTPEDKQDAYREKYEQLLAHDFKPLGIHWSRIGRTISTESYVFGSSDHRCLAQIYSRSHNLYLVSAFKGGDVIYTMDTYPKEQHLPGYRVTGLLDPTVEELLAEHRRQVNEWTAEGRELLPTASLEDAPPIFGAVNTHPASNRLLASAAASNLGFALFILAAGGGLAGWLRGFSGPAPWIGVIAGGAFMKWLWSDASTRAKLDRNKTQLTEVPVTSESSSLPES